MKLVVIPLRLLINFYTHHILRCSLFPDIPPLGSTWRATVEYVHVYRNQRESRFLRIAFEQTPEFLGTIKPTLSRRTITFGERKSSFYCEMLQVSLYISALLVADICTSKTCIGHAQRNFVWLFWKCFIQFRCKI